MKYKEISLQTLVIIVYQTESIGMNPGNRIMLSFTSMLSAAPSGGVVEYHY